MSTTSTFGRLRRTRKSGFFKAPYYCFFNIKTNFLIFFDTLTPKREIKI
nr:MAG TPA: hypothetical protein [Caudoviricetes sp.]